MQTQKLIATVAAALFTVASLLVVTYNVDSPRQSSADTRTLEVTNLAPITVTPSAADFRAATLLESVGNEVGMTSLPAHARLDDHLHVSQFSLLGSQLVMPYYSFSNKFGRITKE
ncbi:MAG TPA: hypothetical protein VN043_03210 [Rhodanobacter sp.]|nr:hypothetical protein [Rhodanobacter sp.]